MTKENAIKLFQDRRVRVHWNDRQEKDNSYETCWYHGILLK